MRLFAHFLRCSGLEVDDFTDERSGRYNFRWFEVGTVDKLDAVAFLQDERVQKAFREDKQWLDWADAVLLILPAGRSAHLEAGYAKGRGKLLVIWQAAFPRGEFETMYGFADLITNDPLEVVDFLRRRDNAGLPKEVAGV